MEILSEISGAGPDSLCQSLPVLPVGTPGSQKPYSLSLGVRHLIYRQKNLVMEGELEVDLPALRKHEKGSRGVGPQVTLQRGLHGLGGEESEVPAALSL